MRYLLDTNVISAFIRNPSSPVLDRIEAVGTSEVCTSVIVAAELRFGAARQQNSSLVERVEAALGRLNVVPWDYPADVEYARIRAMLEASGTPIGSNDLLIAAQTLALELTLVTDNEREFRRVEGLDVENWLR